jgi:hypothetical protein
LLFAGDIRGQTFRRGIGVVLHHRILVVKFIHGLDDLAAADMIEEALQSLLQIRRTHFLLLS